MADYMEPAPLDTEVVSDAMYSLYEVSEVFDAMIEATWDEHNGDRKIAPNMAGDDFLARLWLRGFKVVPR